MKRRIYGVCALVFYLLTLCLALSVKIDNEMLTEVVERPVIVNEKSTGSFILLSSCLYDLVTMDDNGMYSARYAIYELVDGDGWQQGLRVSEVPSGKYSLFTENGVFMLADFSTNVSRTIVQDASRQPEDGQHAVVIEQTTGGTDQYLIYYPTVPLEYQDCAEGYTLAASGDSTRLLDVADASVPFLEEEAYETLYKIMTANSEIFSLNDVETFLRTLPRAALAAVLLLLPLPLWIWILLWWGKPERNGRLLLAVGAVLVFTLAALGVLWSFDLPSSLMPIDNIFDLAYYRQEFGTFFQALQEVDPNQESAVYTAAAYARRQCTACAIGGGLAFLLTALLPALGRRRKEDE